MKRSRRLVAQALLVVAFGGAYLSLPEEAGAATLGCDLNDCLTTCIEADWNACFGCGLLISTQCEYDAVACPVGRPFHEYCGFDS